MIAAEEGHVRPVRDGEPARRRAQLLPRPAAGPTAPRGPRVRRRGRRRGGRVRAAPWPSSGVNGVLGPVLDVSPEGGSALGALAYSDDPAEVVGVRRRRAAPPTARPGCSPRSRTSPAWDRPTSPRTTARRPSASGCPELRKRDLLPFRAAIEDGAPGLRAEPCALPNERLHRPGLALERGGHRPAARRAGIPGRGDHRRPRRAGRGDRGIRAPGGGGGAARRGGHAR